MELKNFNDFIAEAKDSQKSKVNNDMHSKDATHGEKPQVLDTKVKADGNNYEGDKPDILDTSINEADAQKAKENADLKANDASHGEKAQVVKEGEDKGKILHGEKDDDCDDELDESVISGTIRCLIREGNNGRVRAIATLTDDKNIDKLLKYAKLPPEAKEVILQGKEYTHGDAKYLFDDIKEF